MPMIKLIATDIDGTFLTSQWKPRESTVAAFNEARDKGIEIVPATGRVYNSLSQIIDMLTFVNYVVTSNGISVSKLNGEPIFTSIMPRRIIDATVSAAKSLGINAEVYVGGQAYAAASQFRMMDGLDIPDHVRTYIAATRKAIENFDEFVVENYDNIEGMDVLALPHGILPDLRAKLLAIEGVCPTSTSEWHVDVGYNGISKGHALKVLGEKLGIKPSEMIAFGDSENDIEMLKFVGIGVAMGNASDEVKAAADYVTDDNNSDGIRNALLHFGVI